MYDKSSTIRHYRRADIFWNVIFYDRLGSTPPSYRDYYHSDSRFCGEYEIHLELTQNVVRTPFDVRKYQRHSTIVDISYWYRFF